MSLLNDANLDNNSLLKTIDDQNIKIQTYKTKLRDVIQAYKDLNKEKCTLESSMSALLGEQSSTKLPNNESVAVDESSCEEKSVRNANTSDAEFKKQILTLTESLVSMTTQKNKFESTYIAEKKLLKQEFEERSALYQEEILDSKANIASLTDELESYKKRLTQQQLEHESESTNHAIMLRELQTIVSTERTSKENLETQLEEILLLVDEKNSKLQKQIELFQNEEINLKNKISILSKLVEDNKMLFNDSQNQVECLQKELIVAQQFEVTLSLNQQESLNDKISQLVESNKRSEQRVSQLEREIMQLSMAVGDAQRCKVGDLKSIQSLKDKCFQLQQENLQLSSLVSSQCKSSSEDLDVAELIEEIQKHLEQLKLKNYDLNLINDSIESLCNLHTKCHEKYDQLNEEFEKYKLRAQSVLKNKSKDSAHGSERELQSLHNQVAEYKERSTGLRKLLEEKETEMRNKEQMLKSTAEAMNLKLHKDIEKLLSSHSAKVHELEHELRLMRERTIALLIEKDEEVQQLKSMTCVHAHIDATDGFMSEETSIPRNSSTELVVELLNARHQSTSLEAPLLHYAEEKGRLDLELSTLKKQKQQLQTEVRELQRNFALRETELSDRIETLEEKLRKVNRDTRREDANLEYLKNVILSYVSSDCDSSGRKRMLNAIATILQFSPAERQLVFNKDKKQWWN